jgi:hypothetical protein
MARGGILAGSDPDGPDPDKGKPFRHTRQKCRLMMRDMGDGQCRKALTLLMDKRPDEVLDALIEVSGDLARPE